MTQKGFASLRHRRRKARLRQPACCSDHRPQARGVAAAVARAVGDGGTSGGSRMCPVSAAAAAPLDGETPRRQLQQPRCLRQGGRGPRKGLGMVRMSPNILFQRQPRSKPPPRRTQLLLHPSMALELLILGLAYVSH